MARPRTRMEGILGNKALVEELLDEGGALTRSRIAEKLHVDPRKARDFLAGARGGRLRPMGMEETPAYSTLPGDAAVEAIVLLTGRPSLLIRDGRYEEPDTQLWRERLGPHRAALETSIASVGRLELLHHDSLEWGGTAWMVAPEVAVTNRHVAELFAAREGDRWLFARNLEDEEILPRVDFREEFGGTTAQEVRVREILYVASPGTEHADLAVVRLEAGPQLPAPIRLAERDVAAGAVVAVLGYPFRDSRNGAQAQDLIFGGELARYGVKRLAPGEVMAAEEAEHFFTHDASTLGGNSGSVVVDVASGSAVGVHFAGSFTVRNYAVKASALREVVAGLGTRVVVPVEEAPMADGVRKPEHYRDRRGYRRDFLGRGAARRVDLPGLGPWGGDVTPLEEGAGEGHELAYEHFTVVMCRSRRLPLFTAVNIDGSTLRFLARSDGSGSRDRWYLDGRIDLDAQLGNEAYRGNKLDRGHMVRRLDPVWGPREEAQRANDDTFVYTNSCPQHEALNQIDWLSLEEYLLDNASANDLKVSVITGPVLRASDPEYRDFQVPREYWKVAVMVHPEGGRLSATGYLLSQGTRMDDLEAPPFVFGRFRTYQIPIARIMERSGLDFTALRGFDPLEGSTESLEGVAIAGARLVRGAGSLRL